MHAVFWFGSFFKEPLLSVIGAALSGYATLNKFRVSTFHRDRENGL